MNKRTILVGDNPFQGVSHLTQERERTRNKNIASVDYAANIVRLSLENGADGFMFSLNDNIISIIEKVVETKPDINMKLYPTVPSAYEYVRRASQSGITGLMIHVATQVAKTANFRAMGYGIDGVIKGDPVSLLKAYINYEISRVQPLIKTNVSVDSLLLHEIVCDMALGFDWKWLFEVWVNHLLSLGMKPGFETRNFVTLVNKLKDWGFDLSKITINAPFNKTGFQMTPSGSECENTLTHMPDTEVIVFSILASGYVKLDEAIDYMNEQTGLTGVVIGVSSEKQARETFRQFKNITNKG